MIIISVTDFGLSGGLRIEKEMMECFFSGRYANRGDLFEGLFIWEEEKYKKLQGTYPVISLSFANVKEEDCEKAIYRICQLLKKQYEKCRFLTEGNILSDAEKIYFEKMASAVDKLDAPMAVYQLSDYLYRYYEKKVIILLDEYGLSEEKEEVKKWYDGFNFGSHKDIYNPWSIINFLSKKEYKAYWANTSSNDLVGRSIRKAGGGIKKSFEDLINGKAICCPIDEQLVYNQLDRSESAIWSFLVASGYLNQVQEGDVVIDEGVAEGKFAFSVIDRVKKVYLIEG